MKLKDHVGLVHTTAFWVKTPCLDTHISQAQLKESLNYKTKL